jgi:3-methyladenine DNA glycosylase Tag
MRPQLGSDAEKRQVFRQCFDNFEYDRIAAYRIIYRLQTISGLKNSGLLPNAETLKAELTI